MILNEEYCPLPPWLSGTDNKSDIVISSRIRLARNIDNHRFPVKASLQERKDIFDLVSTACRRIPKCRSWSVSNFLTMSALARKVLVEERMASPELETGEGDRGLVADSKRGTSIMVNEEDHVRLTVVGAGDCARALWKTAESLETALGKKVSFAFDRTRGYLTCCPTNAGTGLRVSYLLHLPGLTLTRTVDQILQGASQTGFSTRGFFGEHSDIVGNFFQFSNQATLGVTEEEFIDQTEKMVKRVCGFERDARLRIVKDAKIEIQDKIWRSFGILSQARSLSMVEFLNLASALRLGIDLGLFDKLGREELNRIMICVMPAHMQVMLSRDADERELAVQRAELVRGFLVEQNG